MSRARWTWRGSGDSDPESEAGMESGEELRVGCSIVVICDVFRSSLDSGIDEMM